MTNYRCSTDLLNNAFDFLEGSTTILSKFSAGRKYISPTDLKISLISCTTAVELILKAKIASIDWREVFQDPSKADTLKIKTGDFKSISFEKCPERLEELMSARLPDGIKAKIEKVRNIRNKLIHYDFGTHQEAFATLVSDGIDAFIEFYRLYIFVDFCEEKDRTKVLEEELFKVDEYIKARLETVMPKLQGLPRPRTYYFIECNNCLQDLFILKNKNTVQCLFCETEDNIEDYALTISEIPGQTKICPTCNISSMTALEKRPPNEEQAWDCILCGHYINRGQRWVGGGNGSVRAVI